MLTQSQKKLIKSLHDKKGRAASGLFLVEGEKSVAELLKSDFQIEMLLVTEEFFRTYKNFVGEKPYAIADQEMIEKLGTLESNDSAIAVARQKTETALDMRGIVLTLDKIQDPGNLGTIIRIADWYEIKNIICSEDTADLYNAKTIGASMGSFTRMHVSYQNLEKFLGGAQAKNIPIFGAFLSGENLHTTAFPKDGILLMGNESKGISKNLERFVSKKITIPSFGGAESLNVAIATAIILDNWKNAI
jgi:TrmH family RNA methyltransferase